MTSSSSLDQAAILNAYDFSGFGRIVDVAGGHGALLQGILERFPNSLGVLCELPAVLAGAHGIEGSSVAPRCELVGMDMFRSVPVNGDAYVLKRVVHDWSDAEATRILRNCRSAIAPRAGFCSSRPWSSPRTSPTPRSAWTSTCSSC